jgi:hypothetical protein
MTHAQRRRFLLAGGLGAGATLAGLLVAMLAHAGALRAASTSPAAERERAAVVRLVGAPDLAISSSSRWLRHPSLSEPGAAFADGPAVFDPDPAGAALGAPRALYRGTERGGLVARRQGASAR